MSTQAKTTQVEISKDEKRPLNMISFDLFNISWNVMGTSVCARVYSVRDELQAILHAGYQPTTGHLKKMHREWSGIVEILGQSKGYSQFVRESAQKILSGLTAHI